MGIFGTFSFSHVRFQLIEGMSEKQTVIQKGQKGRGWSGTADLCGINLEVQSDGVPRDRA